MEERIFCVYVNTLFCGNKGIFTQSTPYAKQPMAVVTKVVTIAGISCQVDENVRNRSGCSLCIERNAWPGPEPKEGSLCSWVS